MKALALALLAVAAIGCSVAGGTPAPPSGRPSSAPNGTSPPPAWVETSRGSFWLGYSTYCWNSRQGDQGVGTCADYVAPSCRGPSKAPRIAVNQGEVVQFHLGFDVREPVRLTIFREGGGPVHEAKLERSRNPTWTVTHTGPLSLFNMAKGNGDASYVACFAFGV